MEHRLAIRLGLLVATLTLTGCGGSMSAPTTSATPTATVTAVPTIIATAVPEPTSAPTPTPRPPLTGRILFTAVAAKETFGSIYVMNVDGSGVVKLTGSQGGDEPAWSPNGTQVAFVRTDGIWVMNADGSQPRRIRHVPSTDDQWPVWSPDGRLISFLEAPVCGHGSGTADQHPRPW
jgi:dipeptidyl aminopeptidase/acylaminoacyl peptidase